MSPGPGHARIGGARIKWDRLADDRVCYEAKWPDYRPGFGSVPGECIRHLRADQIAFVTRRRDRSGQWVIAGLKGPRVQAVHVRLFYPTRTWSPGSSGGAFFGYVPRGTVTEVVKVLHDGTKKAFRIHLRSR